MDLTENCIITWKEPVFIGGSFYRGRCSGAKYVGDRTIKGKIVKESYGSTGQHTFTILIETCDGENADEYSKGQKIRRKGRNLYPNLLNVETPPTEQYELLREEKHSRKKQNTLIHKSLLPFVNENFIRRID